MKNYVLSIIVFCIYSNPLFSQDVGENGSTSYIEKYPAFYFKEEIIDSELKDILYYKKNSDSAPKPFLTNDLKLLSYGSDDSRKDDLLAWHRFLKTEKPFFIKDINLESITVEHLKKTLLEASELAKESDYLAGDNIFMPESLAKFKALEDILIRNQGRGCRNYLQDTLKIEEGKRRPYDTFATCSSELQEKIKRSQRYKRAYDYEYKRLKKLYGFNIFKYIGFVINSAYAQSGSNNEVKPSFGYTFENVPIGSGPSKKSDAIYGLSQSLITTSASATCTQEFQETLALYSDALVDDTFENLDKREILAQSAIEKKSIAEKALRVEKELLVDENEKILEATKLMGKEDTEASNKVDLLNQYEKNNDRINKIDILTESNQKFFSEVNRIENDLKNGEKPSLNIQLSDDEKAEILLKGQVEKSNYFKQNPEAKFNTNVYDEYGQAWEKEVGSKEYRESLRSGDSKDYSSYDEATRRKKIAEDIMVEGGLRGKEISAEAATSMANYAVDANQKELNFDKIFNKEEDSKQDEKKLRELAARSVEIQVEINNLNVQMETEQSEKNKQLMKNKLSRLEEDMKSQKELMDDLVKDSHEGVDFEQRTRRNQTQRNISTNNGNQNNNQTVSSRSGGPITKSGNVSNAPNTVGLPTTPTAPAQLSKDEIVPDNINAALLKLANQKNDYKGPDMIKGTHFYKDGNGDVLIKEVDYEKVDEVELLKVKSEGIGVIYIVPSDPLKRKEKVDLLKFRDGVTLEQLRRLSP